MENKRINLRGKILLVACGIVLSLIVVEIGLRLAGWAYLSYDMLRNNITRQNIWAPNTVRILCLGTCYTVGVGVSPEHSYPRYLQQMILQHYPHSAFAVINRGVRSKNLSYFAAHLQQSIERYRPHCIILNINNRIDIRDRNFILSNRRNFPFRVRLKIGFDSFFEKLKIYRFAKLMFNKNESFDSFFLEPMNFERVNDGNSPYVSKINALEKDVQNNPRNLAALHELADSYYSLGLFQNAAENTWKAIGLSPGNGWYYLDLFWDYVFLKEYEKAVEVQKKALDMSPQIKAVLVAQIKTLKEATLARSIVFDKFYLSDNYALIGDYAGALRECREALQKDPFFVEYYDKMAFYESVVSNGDRVDRGGYFFADENKPWEFIQEVSRRWNRADGYEMFYRLLRYDLETVLGLTKRRGIKIFLENMGSAFQQQAVIHKVCAELKIPLVDLYAVFNKTADKTRLFHPSLTSRLSAEGNEFMAGEIYRDLEAEGFFDEYR